MVNKRKNLREERRKLFLFLEFLSNQMSVLVDLLNNIPKSIIQDEIVSVRNFN